MCPSNTKQIQRCSVRLSWRNLKEERTCEEKRKRSSDTQRLWRRRKVYNPDFIKAPWSGWILSLFIAQTLLYSGNRLTRSTQPTWFSSRTETVSLHTHIWSEPQDRYRQELRVRLKTVELKHLGERGGDILSSPSSFILAVPGFSWRLADTAAGFFFFFQHTCNFSLHSCSSTCWVGAVWEVNPESFRRPGAGREPWKPARDYRYFMCRCSCCWLADPRHTLTGVFCFCLWREDRSCFLSKDSSFYMPPPPPSFSLFLYFMSC